jgi:hypothetical protein
VNPWFCTLCDEFVEPEDILTGNHYRVMHPDTDAEATVWPDSDLVVFDDTVDEEFR